MEDASSGDTSSSASSESIQSPVAFSITEFFCALKPFHDSTKTFAPSFAASSQVLSVDPLSTMTTSSAHDTLANVRGRLASSLRVMMQTDKDNESSLAAALSQVVSSLYVQASNRSE